MMADKVTRLRLPPFDNFLQHRAYDLRALGLGKKRILRYLKEAFPEAPDEVMTEYAAEAASQSKAHCSVRVMHASLRDEEWEEWDGTDEGYRRIVIDALGKRILGSAYPHD